MAAYDGGHASKRQRTDANGYSGGQKGRETNYIDPPPSPVVFIRGLSDTVADGDLVNDLRKFGQISHHILLAKKRQAFVEFEDINDAMNLVKHAKGSQVYVGNRPAQFNYSTNQKLDRQPGRSKDPGELDNAAYLLDDFNRGEERPNNVLLLTILNPQYPITVEVINTICSTSGKVLRIVIFKKQGVQAMVEFDNIQSAQQAKSALNGCDIYSGCCTLKIEYARTNRLNVVRNDGESWDYTNPNLGQEPERRNAPLLPDPQFGGPPKSQYGQPEPPRRDPYDNYGRPGQQDRFQDNRYQGGQASHDQYGPPPPNDPYSRGPSDPYSRGPPPPQGGGDPYGRGPAPGEQYGGQDQPPSAGMLQQGSVLMLYGLNMNHMNCQRVFNLFCLYGNVVRVKFLRSKEGSAMIQMGDPSAMDRAMKNLGGCMFFENKLTLGFSKQAFLQDVPNPHDLADGTKSFVDFMGTRNNRFTTPEAAAKNRIQPPGKTLYYWNAPPNLDEEKINELFEDFGLKRPDAIKIFPSRTEKSSTGLIEWDDRSEAIEALIVANHKEMENPQGKYPFVMKMCFSGNAINRSKLGNKQM